MGLETRLRNKVKNEYDSGASIYSILHPNTREEDPDSLRVSSDLIRQQILAGNFTNAKSNAGYGSKINSKVDYDLAYAKRVYLAFDVPIDSETRVAELQTILESYLATEDNRDDKELKQDLIKDTLIALKRSEATAAQIESSFVRTSVVSGIITLESLALYLGVSFNSETQDSDLATLIKDKIDLL